MEIITFASIITAVISYLLGSINTSIIIGKKTKGIDIREKGSKNAGTTNALRVLGKKAGAIVLICDILKAVISIGIAILVSNITKADDEVLLKSVAAIAVILGHIFPVFYGFKGGKGVATALGSILMLDGEIGVICLLFALVIIIATKMVSLGSILAAVLFPILTFVLAPKYFFISLAIAIIVIIKHRANIQRILEGKENKLSFKK